MLITIENLLILNGISKFTTQKTTFHINISNNVIFKNQKAKNDYFY